MTLDSNAGTLLRHRIYPGLCMAMGESTPVSSTIAGTGGVVMCRRRSRRAMMETTKTQKKSTKTSREDFQLDG